MINCFFKLIAASSGLACYLHGFLVLHLVKIIANDFENRHKHGATLI